VTDLLSVAPPGRTRPVAGLLGLTAGVVVAGAAAGLAAERMAVRRALGRRDPMRDEPFGTLRGAPATVTADDGVRLHVEVDEPEAELGGKPGARPDSEPPGPPVTIVFSHGYALNLDSWHFQRRDLRDVGRLVLWDQRSHGRSGRSAMSHATIEQIGRDLGQICDEVAPEGPLVLVGHSMGGMTIMSLAEQRPELFRERVIGVALLATSAAGLGEMPLGLRGLPGRALGRVAPGVVRLLGKRGDLIDRGRQMGSDLAYVLTRRYSFASDVPPSYVAWTAEMLAATPMEVVADFYPDFDRHDRRAALAAMRDIPALVMVGREDRVTPLEHTEVIADELPHAELVVLERCGHMLLLEHHDVVTDQLRTLVARSLAAL
jgi:pimeloyl-ACP methyl ester carboxylesterase